MPKSAEHGDAQIRRARRCPRSTCLKYFVRNGADQLHQLIEAKIDIHDRIHATLGIEDGHGGGHDELSRVLRKEKVGVVGLGGLEHRNAEQALLPALRVGLGDPPAFLVGDGQELNGRFTAYDLVQSLNCQFCDRCFAQIDLCDHAWCGPGLLLVARVGIEPHHGQDDDSLYEILDVDLDPEQIEHVVDDIQQQHADQDSHDAPFTA